MKKVARVWLEITALLIVANSSMPRFHLKFDVSLKFGVWSLMFWCVLPTLPATIISATPSLHIRGHTYSVGLSKIDVTPSYPVRLNGYLGRTTESTNAVG